MVAWDVRREKASKGSSQSRALYYKGKLDGRGRNWVDRAVLQAARQT